MATTRAHGHLTVEQQQAHLVAVAGVPPEHEDREEHEQRQVRRRCPVLPPQRSDRDQDRQRGGDEGDDPQRVVAQRPAILGGSAQPVPSTTMGSMPRSL